MKDLWFSYLILQSPGPRILFLRSSPGDGEATRLSLDVTLPTLGWYGPYTDATLRAA